MRTIGSTPKAFRGIARDRSRHGIPGLVVRKGNVALLLILKLSRSPGTGTVW